MGNNKGWIKLPRNIIDEPIWPKTRPYTKTEAWLRIVIEVNYAENKCMIGNQVVDCLRGQKLYSLQTWANIFNWNRTQVKRYFILLEKLSLIRTKVVQKTTQITVCNYDDYHDERNDSETILEQKRNDSETILHTIKKGKKDKNKKSVCNTTTHTFSVEDIEKLFVQRESILGKKANKGVATRFHNHYNPKRWIFDGKPMEDLTPHIDKWIREDVLSRHNDEKTTGKMVVKLPEQYLPAGNPVKNQ